MKLQHLIVLVSFLFLMNSCKQAQESKSVDTSFHTIPLKYATSFLLSENNQSFKIELINAEDKSIIAAYTFPKRLDKTYRTAVFSSSVIGYLDVLGQLKTVIGVEKLNSIYNSELVHLKESDSLKEYIDYSLANPEKLHRDGVNLLFYSIFTAQLNPIDQKLKQLNITAIPLLEWKEQDPLGKAEWLKLYGVVFGCYDTAVIAFNEIESNYLRIKNESTLNSLKKPKVLTNSMFQDVWYLSGGNSYMAKFIADAGGDYVLKGDQTTGGKAFTFEQIYTKYKGAAKWINSTESTKKELLSAYEGYQNFKAFKTSQMYTFTENSVKYFEEAPVKPHLLLKDLITIFSSDTPKDLYFYDKVE